MKMHVLDFNITWRVLSISRHCLTVAKFIIYLLLRFTMFIEINSSWLRLFLRGKIRSSCGMSQHSNRNKNICATIPRYTLLPSRNH